MIDGIGRTGLGRIGLSRASVDGGANVARAGNAAAAGRSGAVESSVSDIVAAGPPIDAEKIASIRAAIAENRYPVDPDKIAERMIALDLPSREA